MNHHFFAHKYKYFVKPFSFSMFSTLYKQSEFSDVIVNPDAAKSRRDFEHVSFVTFVHSSSFAKNLSSRFYRSCHFITIEGWNRQPKFQAAVFPKEREKKKREKGKNDPRQQGSQGRAYTIHRYMYTREKSETLSERGVFLPSCTACKVPRPIGGGSWRPSSPSWKGCTPVLGDQYSSPLRAGCNSDWKEKEWDCIFMTGCHFKIDTVFRRGFARSIEIQCRVIFGYAPPRAGVCVCLCVRGESHGRGEHRWHPSWSSCNIWCVLPRALYTGWKLFRIVSFRSYRSATKRLQ